MSTFTFSLINGIRFRNFLCKPKEAKVTDIKELLQGLVVFGGIFGGISAVASGTVAWGTHCVKWVPTQSPLGAAVAGGFFGFVAGAIIAYIDESKMFDINPLPNIAISGTFITAAFITAAFAPTVARGLANREISHLAAGAFGVVDAVATILVVSLLF